MSGIVLRSPLTGAEVGSLKRRIENPNGQTIWFGMTHQEMQQWNLEGPGSFPLLNGDQGFSPNETYAVYDSDKKLLPKHIWEPMILGEFAPFAVEILQQVHLQAKACSKG